MSWINPPAHVKRFSLLMVVQHWAAALLGAALALSAAAAAFPGHAGWNEFHARAGTAGAAFLAFHLLFLMGAGVRNDIPLEKVAFMPSGDEWRALRGKLSRPPETGKYSPEEKGDYLNILLWSFLVAVTGILMRWPGRLGVPGPGLYAWLKVAHAGCGASLLLHVLVVHVPGRWLRAPAPLRRAILTGRTTLSEASKRTGWIADLVAEGTLVPVPEETRTETSRESERVRGLLEAGNRLVGEERYAEACLAFEEALILFPDYSQARFNLAVARMRQGRLDQAAEQFRLFMERDPFNPVAGKAKELLEEVLSRTGIAGGKP